MSERVRAFMAVLLPADLRSAAGAVQEQMRARFPAGLVRWVAEENFHLTARFFGDLDRKALEKATSVVGELEKSFRPTGVRITGPSAFPSPARPQTLWLGIDDGGGALEALAAEIDRRIRLAGFGPADKPWKSHLTLGRANRDSRERAPANWTTGLTWDPGVFTIETVALMQSELRPQGPRYTALRTASASS